MAIRFTLQWGIDCDHRSTVNEDSPSEKKAIFFSQFKSEEFKIL